LRPVPKPTVEISLSPATIPARPAVDGGCGFLSFYVILKIYLCNKLQNKSFLKYIKYYF
jgi:hypothetical protein